MWICIIAFFKSNSLFFCFQQNDLLQKSSSLMSRVVSFQIFKELLGWTRSPKVKLQTSLKQSNPSCCIQVDWNIPPLHPVTCFFSFCSTLGKLFICEFTKWPFAWKHTLLDQLCCSSKSESTFKACWQRWLVKSFLLFQSKTLFPWTRLMPPQTINAYYNPDK